MHKRGLCRHAVSVCLSLCLSVMEFEANGPIQLFENEVNTSVREYLFYVFFQKPKT